MVKECRKIMKYFKGYGSPHDTTIIKLAKKQVPVKTKDHIAIHDIIYCPICGQDLARGLNPKYCLSCGQALKIQEVQNGTNMAGLRVQPML